MQKILMIKLGTIILLSLILLIPLNMISGKISERSYFKIMAEQSIAESWTGQQKILSPVLVIPYTLEWEVVFAIAGSANPRVETRREVRYHYIAADQISIESSILTDMRARGIYEVPVYTSKMGFAGEFNPALIGSVIRGIKSEVNFFSLEPAYLSVAVSDPRGINSIPELQWNTERVAFEPGSQFSSSQNGLHAELGSLEDFEEELDEAEPINFQFELELRGMKSLSFVPVARQSEVNISSSWQHPNFFGDFLPVTRDISAEGFLAQWTTNSFSTNIEDKLLNCQLEQCQSLFDSEFGVSLIEPVDIYLQTERSVKYGILFIGLSFIAFFIFEVLYKLPIHSIQYMLTGLANAIFYLLLISLSEHISFGLSYLIATLSCVGLLAFYLRSILQKRGLATLFSSAVLVMYGVLYVIIQSEDYALLMGSLLSFSMLTLIMVTTRNIEWSRVGEFQLKEKQDELT